MFPGRANRKLVGSVRASWQGRWKLPSTAGQSLRNLIHRRRKMVMQDLQRQAPPICRAGRQCEQKPQSSILTQTFTLRTKMA